MEPVIAGDSQVAPISGHAGKYSGFPKQGNRSQSFWLQGAAGDELLNHTTTAKLPASADVVVIGSGMTGTLVAKHYIERWPEHTVVVLEAREFCSGATGRNAGHCKPDQWRGFASYEKKFGTSQALKILENEHETWSGLVNHVQEEDIDCDLWVGHTMDVPMTMEAAKIASNEFQNLRTKGGRVDHIKVISNSTLAAKTSQLRDAQACYAWPASTLNPWKLTAHVMRANLAKGVNLQTNTPATKVIPSLKTAGKWVVKTERGDIECLQVVHATNAYSSALEPTLRGLIRPTPHICQRAIPPVESVVNRETLQHSYGVLLGNGSFFSINPRTAAERSVLFGGDNPGQHEFEKWLQDNPTRCTDDGLVSFPSITQAVEKFTEAQLGWGAHALSYEGDSICQSWSGIIALSADGVPFIGELPGLPGQWICAGHHGHGMARIFTAAPALVKLMGGSSWAETRLPEVFQITLLRMNRLNRLNKESSNL